MIPIFYKWDLMLDAGFIIPWIVVPSSFVVPHFLFGIAFLLWCRGIDVVRNKIKMFAQKKVTLPPGRHKVVILDEADRFVLLS